MENKESPLLQITNLSVAYETDKEWLTAVHDFSLSIQAGETVGLVGESGSGKSTIALAVMGYLNEDGRIDGGEILFNGRNLLDLDAKEMGAFWGQQINMVPQDPQSALNPSLKVQEQIAELLQQHTPLNKAAAKARTVELLDMVRVPDPARVADSYPHQISGGMQQRVMIAMALATEPPLLLLDEPTTNLDVTTQATVLDLFRDLIKARDTAVLYVTHNLGVVANMCDRVAVLYASEFVEEATASELFHKPLHPYTQGLLDSVPQLGHNKVHSQLPAISGQIPSLKEKPPACVFAPRCPLAIEKCHTERPFMESTPDGRQVRCHRWQEIANDEISARHAETAVPPKSNDVTDLLLQLENIEVYFDVNRSLIDTLRRAPQQKVKAVDGLNLTLKRGETLGLVGESGSGKTTLARAIIGLTPRTGGEIVLLDARLPEKVSQRTVDTLKHVQYVFQNPEEALNPYMSVGETLRRPFMTLLNLSREEADQRAAALLEDVRLPADYLNRPPNQLSGGEKQRIAIARAYATNPDLLIADEAVSALDVSVQASILNLLNELQQKNNNTMLFISHDLAVVGYLADRIAVVYVGKLMEIADAQALFQSPYHPYTEALLSAIPLTDPDAQQKQIRLQGDVPSQTDVPSGCPFHPRCPRYLGDICHTETPPWQTLANGKQIFCHIPVDELITIQERDA